MEDAVKEAIKSLDNVMGEIDKFLGRYNIDEYKEEYKLNLRKKKLKIMLKQN